MARITLIVLSSLGFAAALFPSIVIPSHASGSLQSIDVQVGDNTYPLFYSFSYSGSIKNVTVEDSTFMVISFTYPVGGYLDLTFPRELYDVLLFTDHYEPAIFTDDEVAEFQELSRTCEQISLRIDLGWRGSDRLELTSGDILEPHDHPFILQLEQNVTGAYGNGEKEQVRVGLRTNAMKCDLLFIQEEKKIHADIEGRSEMANEGYFSITIPHRLLGGNYTVLVDGKQVDFAERQYRQNGIMVISSLEFRYPQNASSIDVIGTSVIPEFGSFSIIVTAVGMASILILSSRKKSCGRNRI